MRYFFEISYNGANYNGWQSQNNARGVQSVVEECLSRLLRKETPITGSGRTDSGVHCEQQFFHSDLEDQPDHLLHKLNSILPPDIAIHSIVPVRSDAHARYDAIERAYQYRITLVRDVFAQGLAWHFFKPLDVPTMNEAAALLVGKHDFTSFSKVNTDVKNFICDIHEARWEPDGVRLQFNISANRFLRGMVRAIVGSLIDVGLKRTTTDDFINIIRSRDRRVAGQNVPPHGLYLTRVKYPERIFELDS